jgi:hypothetical protein
LQTIASKFIEEHLKNAYETKTNGPDFFLVHSRVTKFEKTDNKLRFNQSMTTDGLDKYYVLYRLSNISLTDSMNADKYIGFQNDHIL